MPASNYHPRCTHGNATTRHQTHVPKRNVKTHAVSRRGVIARPYQSLPIRINIRATRALWSQVARDLSFIDTEHAPCAYFNLNSFLKKFFAPNKRHPTQRLDDQLSPQQRQRTLRPSGCLETTHNRLNRLLQRQKCTGRAAYPNTTQY